MRTPHPWPARADGRPLVIAHRGASAHAAENTLAAFRAAAELGADMWEIDVQLTADSVPVVSHDADLGRRFGRPEAIADLDAATLRRLAPDLPSLAETVALAAALGQALYVELKAAGSGPVAWRLLEAMDFRRAALGSFQVAEVRALADAGCPYLLSTLVPLGVDPFERAEATGADVIHPCWERGGGDRPQDQLTPDLLARAAAAGLGIVLWHEERPAVLADLVTAPVLGICTNQPELMAGFAAVDGRGIGAVCHRGANRHAPENTLAAARLAFDMGASHVEFDVRAAADGSLVVIHDATLDRTTDASGRIADKTAADLAGVDAGGWFAPHDAGEPLPTLRQMIELARDKGGRLYVENKDVAPDRLIAAVREAGFLDRCFFWSGNAALQRGMRQAAPDAVLKSGLDEIRADPGLVDDLRPAIIEIDLADWDAAADWQARGLMPMLQYFGDDPAAFDRIADLAPPLVNLDRADLLLAALRRRQAQRVP
jgi:glycerophosphoryl diester phosphodiesterase